MAANARRDRGDDRGYPTTEGAAIDDRKGRGRTERRCEGVERVDEAEGCADETTRLAMPRRCAFTVSFEIPPGATRDDCARYVEDAVTDYAGCLKPSDVDPEDPEGDPMFGINRDSIKVR